jgi:hypothetical protein
MFHTDRGELARPVTVNGRSTFEGVAGRAHPPDDPLEYPTGPEHRDAAEVASIARQLASGTVPVTMNHPSTMPAAAASDAWIVGVVTGSRVDGDRVVAVMRIDDRRAVELIGSGVKELSLGYATELDARRYQRSIHVDHLAIVQSARCGSTCAVRADASQKAGPCMCKTTDKLDALGPEQRAKLNMRADSHVRHIADDGERTRERRHFVDRELARMDEALLPSGKTLENTYTATGLAELRGQIAMAARTASASIMDPAAREAAIAKYIENELGRRGIKT